ncbi:MAG: DUF502 domain-containing protein [Gemmatimonadetes bacterium]|nr:DUF502 domain-containing protein [Gemmatimonadota bacterium]
MIGWLRRNFITGILALLPLGITAWVLYKVFTTVDGTVRPHITRFIGFEIPGLGFLATILFVLLVGVFASNIIGRTVIGRVEQIFSKVPLVSRIYIAVKQIGEGVIGNKNLFERVILFQYPRPGTWAIGFVTSEHRGKLESKTGVPVLHVFVPTTPNPTSGFLLFVPANEIIDLDISVEDGLKLVISGGAVTPGTADLGNAPVTVDPADLKRPVEPIVSE